VHTQTCPHGWTRADILAVTGGALGALGTALSNNRTHGWRARHWSVRERRRPDASV